MVMSSGQAGHISGWNSGDRSELKIQTFRKSWGRGGIEAGDWMRSPGR